MRDFPYLEPGIQDFKANPGRDSGLKVSAGDGLPKNKPRDYGIA